MGAKIRQGHGFVEASAPKGLSGTKIYLDFPSVGATENRMMAACLAEGETIIENTANEPEISDLADFLTGMGGIIFRSRHRYYKNKRRAEASRQRSQSNPGQN